MKVSIFSNDKSTMKDELFLSAYAAICLIIGILMMIFFTHKSLVILGLMLVMQSVIFFPVILYRFMTNTEINKKKEMDNAK